MGSTSLDEPAENRFRENMQPGVRFQPFNRLAQYNFP